MASAAFHVFLCVSIFDYSHSFYWCRFIYIHKEKHGKQCCTGFIGEGEGEKKEKKEKKEEQEAGQASSSKDDEANICLLYFLKLSFDVILYHFLNTQNIFKKKQKMSPGRCEAAATPSVPGCVLPCLCGSVYHMCS